MRVVRLADVPKAKVEVSGAERAWRQLVISAADGAPNFSFRVFTVEPGGHTPFHEHPFEHLNYVISGMGEVVDGSGGTHPIDMGCFALVLPDEKHQYRNTSRNENLVLLCAVPRKHE